ncbi:hypothetical protein [Thiocapsa rosea]|uniref:Uncharacterized protein n=1 Tax=Thiocapsa rosea TaxID=69360 RepID=A0A495VID0_9GAMM|nr:hypothetical protein [Thiocapsa rosea]RKT47618.1 hypothetical protein BDD21_5219 [Thiocapsa rosea]
MNNLLSGDCGATTGDAPTYSNALSLYQGSFSTSQISLWSAILTGADISAVNGYMQVGNPSTAAFSPPTQVVNTTGAASGIIAIIPVFALDTGIISVASYTIGADPQQSGKIPAPAQAPYLNQVKTNWYSNPDILYQGPQYATQATSQPGYYDYNPTSGVLTVTGVFITTTTPAYTKWQALAFENGNQTIDLTDCTAGSYVQLAVSVVDPADSNSPVTGALSCNAIFPVAETTPITNINSTPTITVIDTADTMSSSGPFSSPAASQILPVTSEGILTVTGYQGNGHDYSFTNGEALADPTNTTGISLDLTTCSEGSDVNLFLYPTISDSPAEAIGYLACAETPTAPLPYSLCTNDVQATGGVVVALTGAPDSDGSGATFDVGCVCIPHYLGGIATGPRPVPPPQGTATFWQTSSGTDANGNPNGLMVGATATNPYGLCN